MNGKLRGCCGWVKVINCLYHNAGMDSLSALISLGTTADNREKGLAPLFGRQRARFVRREGGGAGVQ